MHHFSDLPFYCLIHKQIPMTAVTSVIDGLKKLYIEKLKPLEVTYKFNDFVSPLLVHNVFPVSWYCLSHKWLHSSVFLLLIMVASWYAQNNVNPILFQTSSDFDAKPMVMLLGQYSTGKTTFIKHLLRTSYPGILSTKCTLYGFLCSFE
jgi:EH domain-containing protein 1